MSGIAAVVRPPGSAVDRALLEALASDQAFRGPDAQRIWHQGRIGLVHTLLVNRSGTEHDLQPCSLNEQVWITADARLDAREQLIHALRAAGQAVSQLAPDAVLLLHAWNAWRERLVEHLLGDFAFVLWDARSQVLVAARDQFGIKQLFYAHTAHALAISNTVDVLRRAPLASDRLDDATIADYLLSSLTYRPEATYFADIHALPPGHLLVFDAAQPRIGRYWSLPEADVRMRPAVDVEREFEALLDQAVADRLHVPQVSVSMSGGLDSPLVAATIRDLQRTGKTTTEIRAVTGCYDRWVPDRERHFSGLVADHLQVEHDIVPLDDWPLLPAMDRRGPAIRSPEDVLMRPMVSGFRHRLAARECQVAFLGDGGDELLRLPVGYLPGLLTHGCWRQWSVDLARYLWFLRHTPPLGIRSSFRRRPASLADVGCPTWFASCLARQCDLQGRWKSIWSEREWAGIPPRQARNDAVFLLPLLSSKFASYDAGRTGLPLEYRFPLLDLRLVEFAGQLPAVPWGCDKLLIRRVAHRLLPGDVVRRPKTGVPGDPLLEQVRAQGRSVFPPLEPLYDYMAPWVDVDLWRREFDAAVDRLDGVGLYTHLRPLCLAIWIAQANLSGGSAGPSI